MGDYRRWLPGYEERPKKRRRLNTWGDDYELWKLDLRGFDVGIVGDKVERAVREAYTKHLLLDSKSRKVYLVLPSVLPQQILNEILRTLFENFQMPSVTLLSPSILSTAAAGCRSGLVVDIGWTETIVTAVYQYRETCQYRTLRGMKNLTRNMALVLNQSERQKKRHPAVAQIGKDAEGQDETTKVSVEQAEDISARMVWCRRKSLTSPKPDSVAHNFSTLTLDDRMSQDYQPEGIFIEDCSKLLPIQSPFSPSQSLHLPFSAFSDVAENSFFSPKSSAYNLDDHEQPLPELIFKCLVSLAPDVRSVAMSRIMFTGGGSQVPGLKSRVMEDIAAIIDQRGFDPVIGKAFFYIYRRIKEINSNRQSRKLPDNDTDTASELPTRTLASEVAQTDDEIDQKLRKEQEKQSMPTVSGMLRCVESLGAWAGGSLLGSFRIKGIVDIEKEAFLQHGLAGAKRESDINPLQQRKSYTADIGRPGIGDRSSWTLGAWA